MRHKKLQLLVSAYLDDEVNDFERALVDSHLEGCSECRRFIEHATLMREEISALNEFHLTNSFTARVLHTVKKRDEQTVEWLGIEPLARNTFILLAGFVLLIFFFTGFNKNDTSSMNDQLLNRISSNSVSTTVLLQQGNLSKSDVLFAVMTR
jgi:predicted anti-sigma-YlaC factor YlaD